MNNIIYLVDAFAHIYRGYHAVPILYNKLGKPSNALLAMNKFLVGIEKDLKPEYGAFIFDKGAPRERLKILPEYKANRPSMPYELKMQIDPIRVMIKAFGWRIIEKEGFEADDIIATLACKFVDSNISIISNDKDISQIVDDRVKMLVTKPGQKGFETRDINLVKEKFEVTPAQVVDYLSLVGDTSDNIQGVQGIGPKTAAKLLKEYGSLDNVIRSIDQISNEGLRDKIRQSSELLIKNIQLITLDRNVIIQEINTKDNLFINSPDVGTLISLAEEYELKSLLQDVKKLTLKEKIQGELSF